MSVSVEFRYRRGTAGDWATTNPILGAGEPGYDTTTNRLKIGDGLNPWDALPYLSAAGGVAGPSNEAFVYVQGAPLATWTITHARGRMMGVALYVDGELVETDVIANANQVVVTWPYPVSGTAVLT